MTVPDLSSADFTYISRIVHDHIGVAIPAGKEYLVQARLMPIAQREGLDSVGALLDEIRRGDIRLRDDAIDEMATKETFFFRDVRPFDALRTEVLPPLVADAMGRPLRIWSAAAATGQEAYSMAILMAEYFAASPRPHILATDVSRHALARVETGTYRQLEVNRGLPAQLLIKYFVQDGRNWTVRDDLRRTVRCEWLNLIDRFPPMHLQDVILLRNVLTYFDPPTRTAVLGEVARVLQPGGFLLLGATESTYGLSDEFEPMHFGTTVMYQLRNPAEGTQ